MDWALGDFCLALIERENGEEEGWADAPLVVGFALEFGAEIDLLEESIVGGEAKGAGLDENVLAGGGEIEAILQCLVFRDFGRAIRPGKKVREPGDGGPLRLRSP